MLPLLFQFILQGSSGATAAPGNPCVPCPNPFCPQLWAHSRLAAALSTFLAPLRRNRFNHDPHYACEQNSSSIGPFTQVFAHLQVQYPAEPQLTVHKDLNMTNPPMIHGLRAGHDFVSMHCRHCQAQTQTHSNSAAHTRATQTSHRHGRNWVGLEGLWCKAC